MSNIPITQKELAEHRYRSLMFGKMKQVSFAPKTGATDMLQNRDASVSGQPQFKAGPSLGSAKDTVSIIGAVTKICGDEQLLNPDAVMVLDAVRTGLMIGARTFELYCQRSGLDRLIAQNQQRKLPEEHRAEFNEKMETATFIHLFAVNSYVKWKLVGYKADITTTMKLPFNGIPELQFNDPFNASDCMLYYYGWYLERSQAVRDALELIKFTLLYVDAMLDELAKRQPSLKHAEFFTEASYQLEGTDFVLSGFSSQSSVIEIVQEFNRVPFSSIVGNHEAKHFAARTAARLACYDPILRKNPWMELGGMSSIAMGYGSPGTGKSLQIAATATRIAELCERRGIAYDIAPVRIDEKGVPFFFFHPMPDTVVSTFQGGSAEHMVAWMKRLHDADKVIYAPIDDGENNLEERTRQGVSSGVREVVGVFLRYTEGAYAINHGNWAIHIMTNLPEQVDKAVLSRVQARFAIDGARQSIDFADQDYLWLRKLQQVDPAFVDVVAIPGYEYLSQQGELASLTDIETGEVEITDVRLRKMVEMVRRDHKINEAAFYAKLYTAMQQEFPGFTSRDARNITTAVDLRLMDFDIPDSWFDDHGEFFGKPYDERVNILRDLMRQNIKGLSFHDLRFRETVKYLNNAARISSVEFDREVEQALSRAKVREAALALAAERGIDPRFVF